MKFAIAAVLLPALAVLGQDLSGLPTCAQGCTEQSIQSTGCNLIDIGCICKNSAFIGTISCCLKAQCNDADQQTAIKFANQLCSANGVTVPSQLVCSSSSSSSGSGSSTAASSSSITGAAASKSSSAASAASASASSGSSVSSVASSIQATASSAVNAQSSAITSAASRATGAAVPGLQVEQAGGLVGAAALAFAAML